MSFGEEEFKNPGFDGLSLSCWTQKDGDGAVQVGSISTWCNAGLGWERASWGQFLIFKQKVSTCKDLIKIKRFQLVRNLLPIIAFAKLVIPEFMGLSCLLYVS